ncbi:hypothetical protein DPEC_G00065290 [Dallia pectoralis]|uniref:Uncharacterized protein n=1 Tax=Dallia pectoralis TaxID=75939 RepID=A0ACC2H8E5_DALPE|nr:hypothetical protein DPEC_G00065290 [Dallia pectoralis]
MKGSWETSYGIQYGRPSVQSRSIWLEGPWGLSGPEREKRLTTVTSKLTYRESWKRFTKAWQQRNTRPLRTTTHTATQVQRYIHTARPQHGNRYHGRRSRSAARAISSRNSSSFLGPPVNLSYCPQSDPWKRHPVNLREPPSENVLNNHRRIAFNQRLE